MAKSVNKVILLGNVGKDPEIKYTPSGMAIVKLGIATNDSFKDKEGQWQERTEWHNVTFFARAAEVIGQYVKKGGKLYIEGRLKTDSWDDKQTGEKKYRTDIICDQFVLLGGRADSGGASSGEESAQHSAGGYSRNPGAQHNTGRPDDYAAETQISDDDIPF